MTSLHLPLLVAQCLQWPLMTEEVLSLVPAPGSHQVKSSPPGRPAASGLSESCAAAKHKLGQRLHIERAHGSLYSDSKAEVLFFACF